MPTIAVVGGGMTGLVAARDLAASGRARVVLLEADHRLGGKIRTGSLHGVAIEAGPDSFLAREPYGRDLCEELGLGNDLVAPAAFGAHVWVGGKLRPIPAGFVLGFPASPASLLRSGVLSPRGAARALGDLFLPGPLTGPDVSVGAFVRRRFGGEVLRRLVDPILAGTRAGSADGLSLAAAVPQIDSVARTNRSVLLGLLAQQRAGESSGRPSFLGVRGGMERVIERLQDTLADRAEIRSGAAVSRIRRVGDSFVLECSDGGSVDASGVVVATPARAAAGMLEELSPSASRELRGIGYASIAIVNLVYPPDAGRLPPDGSGILVPSSEGRAIAGCTWTSRKWPHAAPAGGELTIRCFVGRAGDDPVLQLDDADLAWRCVAELRVAMALERDPIAYEVTRWPRAIPQYSVGHNERIDRIEAALRPWPGLALAGSAYRGSGLPECIRQGKEAAARVLDAVGAPNNEGETRVGDRGKERQSR